MDQTGNINNFLGKDVLVFKQSDAGEAMLRCIQNAPIEDSFVNIIKALPLSGLTNRYAYALYRIAKCTGVQSIVELGVRESVSSFSFLTAMEQGKLISFDPVLNTIFFPQYNMSEQMKSRWTYHSLLDYEGYEKYGEEIKDFDMLFIDTDPHDFVQASGQLKQWWINNLKPGGFILMDDTSPNHQEETFANKENRTSNLDSKFGTLAAALNFIEEFDDKIDYAFSVENKLSDGILLIKLKEDN